MYIQLQIGKISCLVALHLPKFALYYLLFDIM